MQILKKITLLTALCTLCLGLSLAEATPSSFPNLEKPIEKLVAPEEFSKALLSEDDKNWADIHATFQPLRDAKGYNLESGFQENAADLIPEDIKTTLIQAAKNWNLVPLSAFHTQLLFERIPMIQDESLKQALQKELMFRPLKQTPLYLDLLNLRHQEFRKNAVLASKQKRVTQKSKTALLANEIQKKIETLDLSSMGAQDVMLFVIALENLPEIGSIKKKLISAFAQKPYERTTEQAVKDEGFLSLMDLAIALRDPELKAMVESFVTPHARACAKAHLTGYWDQEEDWGERALPSFLEVAPSSNMPSWMVQARQGALDALKEATPYLRSWAEGARAISSIEDEAFRKEAEEIWLSKLEAPQTMEGDPDDRFLVRIRTNEDGTERYVREIPRSTDYMDGVLACAAGIQTSELKEAFFQRVCQTHPAVVQRALDTSASQKVAGLKSELSRILSISKKAAQVAPADAAAQKAPGFLTKVRQNLTNGIQKVFSKVKNW